MVGAGANIGGHHFRNSSIGSSVSYNAIFKLTVTDSRSAATQGESDDSPDCAFGRDVGTAFYYGTTLGNMGFRKGSDLPLMSTPPIPP